MRWGVAIVLCATACGRLRFDARDDAGGDAEIKYCAQARAVAAGRDHSCLIDPDGAVWCWGSNQEGQVDPSLPADWVVDPVRVALSMPATSVGAGRDFTCVTYEDRRVFCWGSNNQSQLGNPATPGGVRQGPVQVVGISADQLEVGAEHACVRQESDNSVACWGSSKFGEAGGPIDTRSALSITVAGTVGAKQLAIGHRHTCIITATDDVSCWGHNTSCELGICGPNRPTAQVIASASKSRALGLAGRATCSATIAGAIECWGSNLQGQAGIGTTADTPTPTPGLFMNAVELGGTTFGMCARRADGTGGCWGGTETGDGTFAADWSPRSWGDFNPTALATGFYHQCAIVDGEARCWGKGLNGELGRGRRTVTATPTPVDLGTLAVAQVAVGANNVCVRSGTELACWGGFGGSVGHGEFGGTTTPTAINLGTASIDGVTASEIGGCFWNTSEAKCWGTNDHSGLGVNAMIDYSLVPRTVVLGTPIQQMTLGNEFGCARVGGGVECWGRNLAGEVGDNTMTERPGPVPTVPALTGIVAVQAAGRRACALDGANVLRCWGSNQWGELGDGTGLDRDQPTVISVNATAVRSFALGAQHTCAITTTDELYCWGRNENGQVGMDTSGTSVLQPQPILQNAAKVWAGGLTTCASVQSGEVYCWGDGVRGQRADGDPSVAPVSTPRPVPDLNGVDDIALGVNAGCARRGTKVECWGRDDLVGNGDLSGATPAPPHVPCP